MEAPIIYLYTQKFNDIHDAIEGYREITDEAVILNMARILNISLDELIEILNNEDPEREIAERFNIALDELFEKALNSLYNDKLYCVAIDSEEHVSVYGYQINPVAMAEKISELIIIPNWYDKETLEELTEEENINDEDFQEFLRYVSDNLPDDISDTIHNMWILFKEKKKHNW